MDVYFDDENNVLINKLNIRTEQELIDIEPQLFIANVLDASSIINRLNIQSYKVCAKIDYTPIHYYLPYHIKNNEKIHRSIIRTFKKC